MNPSYNELRLGQFAESVAAREPAPGGGAVAAITVSLAAALAAMAARYSEGDADAHLVDKAERLRRRAATLADEDARAYEAVIAARASTRDADAAQRREQVRAALHRATVVPLEIAQLAAETATLAAKLASDGNRTVRGDAVTGVLLADGATHAAAHLVAVNVEAGGGDEELLEQAERCVEDARTASSAVSAPPASSGR